MQGSPRHLWRGGFAQFACAILRLDDEFVLTD
jgi:hypothetical protein